MKQPCLIESCRRLIAKQLPTGYPAIECTARLLHTSERTLQRRLRTHGLGHRDVVEEIRREEACRLLLEPEGAIADIARALGYADPSSFSRAFRRWTRMSPRRYRQRRGL